MRRAFLPAAALCAGLFLAACGSDSPKLATSSKASLPAGENVVSMKKVAFSPKSMAVPAGSTVVWAFNDGSVIHNVHFKDGTHSKTTASGTFERVFDKPGTYAYRCTLHPTMKGTVTVR